MALAAVNRIGAAKKEPAHYWFDRRHVEQFDIRVQSVRTAEGEALTLLQSSSHRNIRTSFRIAGTDDLTVGRTYETENAGLRGEANHAAVRRVVDSVDDPIRRDP
jgi:hypothetical protein